MAVIRDRVLALRELPDGRVEVAFALHAGIYWVAPEDLALRRRLEDVLRDRQEVAVSCRGADRRLHQV